MPYQKLALAIVHLKPSRSPLRRSTSEAPHPSAIARPSMKLRRILPLDLLPSTFPYSTNFSDPFFLTTCPTNPNCLPNPMVTSIFRFTVSSTISFQIRFVNTVFASFSGSTTSLQLPALSALCTYGPTLKVSPLHVWTVINCVLAPNNA